LDKKIYEEIILNKILNPPFKNLPLIIFRIGGGLGDQLGITAIINAHKKNKKFIVISNTPEFFLNNPKVLWNIDIKKIKLLRKKALFLFLKIFQGKSIINFTKKNTNKIKDKNKAYSEEFIEEAKKNHKLFEINALHIRKDLDVKKIEPKIYILEEEIKNFEQKFSFLPKNFSIINTENKESFTTTKSFPAEKYQSLVNKYNEVNWIEIGSINKLSGVTYLGTTLNLRELAILISKSRFIITTEGFINHYASATNTASILIQSGFSTDSIAKYTKTVIIKSMREINCSPCWLTNCNQKRKKCTETITSSQIIKVIKQFKN
jgi:ADP-heptose:LPS heptosyltransferase